MKNTFLIPTDKPSNLFRWDNGTFEKLYPIEYRGKGNYQNIYITSTDDVKDKEYGLCVNLVREGFKSHQSVFKMDAEQREAMEALGGQEKAQVLKVILTTDEDLIVEGIQAIPDKFLEWFVQNPTCESVGLIKKVEPTHWQYPFLKYEIIIPKEDLGYTTKMGIVVSDEMVRATMVPKEYFGREEETFCHYSGLPSPAAYVEEPKQETLVRDYSNRSCQTCNLFNTNNGGERACELELESKCASYGNDETLKDFWISCLDDESDSVLYRKETLEEGFDRIDKSIDYSEIDFASFKLGAQWRDEQEDNKFSEEEVMDILGDFFYDHVNAQNSNIKEWFEQFKKNK